MKDSTIFVIFLIFILVATPIIVVIFSNDESTSRSGTYDPILEITSTGATSISSSGLDEVLARMDNTTLSDEEVNTIQLLRETEKLARDIYMAFSSDWPGVSQFTAIADAEQSHMAAMGMLIERHGIQDPVSSDTAGAYANSNLTDVYIDLLDEGSGGELDALGAAASVCEKSIHDIRALKTGVVSEDVDFVLENLLLSSRNHLRATAGELDDRGSPYSPRYIEIDNYESIMSRSFESKL